MLLKIICTKTLREKRKDYHNLFYVFNKYFMLKLKCTEILILLNFKRNIL
jgi:hypothetical protein